MIQYGHRNKTHFLTHNVNLCRLVRYIFGKETYKIKQKPDEDFQCELSFPKIEKPKEMLNPICVPYQMYKFTRFHVETVLQNEPSNDYRYEEYMYINKTV